MGWKLNFILGSMNDLQLSDSNMMDIYHQLCQVHSGYTQQRERKSERGQRTVSHLQALRNNPQWIHRSHDSPDSTSSHELHSQREWFPASTDCSGHWPLTCIQRNDSRHIVKNTVVFIYRLSQTYMSPMKRLGQTSSTWLPNLFPPYKTFTKSFTERETALFCSTSYIVHFKQTKCFVCSSNIEFQTLLSLYYNHVGTDRHRCSGTKIKAVT